MENIKFIKTPCSALGVVLTKGTDEAKCEGLIKTLKANTTDGATEKHVPVVTIDGKKVTVVVGDVIHPMLDNHYIEFIALETDKGLHIKTLKPGEEPKAEFLLNDEVVVAAYEHCNLHGLWVK